MAEMSSEEQVLHVLQRQEPDCVPQFEWNVDRRVREALYPGCKNYIDFVAHSGVKPENYVAMVDTLHEHGCYSTRI